VERDSVDRILQAWRRRDPQLDSSSLEVTGRLVLCASYYERAVLAVLQPFGLSIADFDVLNTLRRVGDQHGSKPTDLARSSLITTGAMTSQGSKVAGQALHELIAANQVFLEPLSGQQRESLASALKLLLLHHEPR
jgi:hypothetical protein